MLKNKKGVAVFLVVMLGAVILAVVLGLSALLVRQAVIVHQLSQSVLAFYAADTGIERLLYATRQEGYDVGTCTPTPCQTPYPGTSDPAFTNGASYEDYVQDTTSSTELRSIGIYRQVRRALEISY